MYWRMRTCVSTLCLQESEDAEAKREREREAGSATIVPTTLRVIWFLIPFHMYTYRYIYIYIYIYTRIYIYIYLHIYIYIHASFVCIWVSFHICMFIYTCMYLCIYRVAKTHRMPEVAGHFFSKEPLIIGLFCGKWPVQIRHSIWSPPPSMNSIWTIQLEVIFG